MGFQNSHLCDSETNYLTVSQKTLRLNCLAYIQLISAYIHGASTPSSAYITIFYISDTYMACMLHIPRMSPIRL